MKFEPNFHELEYFVPYDRGAEAVAAMRELMLARLPTRSSRWRCGRSPPTKLALALLRARERRHLGVGHAGDGLRAVPARRRPAPGRVRRARPLGKLHYLTAEQLHARYPRAADFIALRRELDPRGVFLNDHLRELFA